MDLRTTVTVSPDVTYRGIGGEIVLFALESECHFGLDEVGARCWELLERHGEIRIVYEILPEEYDVHPERLRADLQQLVSELEQAGLLASKRGGDVPDQELQSEPE